MGNRFLIVQEKLKLLTMKKGIAIIIVLLIITSSVLLVNGCKTPASITAKSGAPLWGENCQRCHNVPSPTTFSDENWEVAGTHMKIRANLTELEKDKIVDFLKSSN